MDMERWRKTDDGSVVGVERHVAVTSVYFVMSLGPSTNTESGSKLSQEMTCVDGEVRGN